MQQSRVGSVHWAAVPQPGGGWLGRSAGLRALRGKGGARRGSGGARYGAAGWCCVRRGIKGTGPSIGIGGQQAGCRRLAKVNSGGGCGQAPLWKTFGLYIKNEETCNMKPDNKGMLAKRRKESRRENKVQPKFECPVSRKQPVVNGCSWCPPKPNVVSRNG
jgi:hypothetical protein